MQIIKLLMKVICYVIQIKYKQFQQIKMAYVQQTCDGYNKKVMMGNWAEERLYPPQPFRQNLQKQVRSKDQGITTFDGTGFQRALPRLERRTKWQTAQRVILNDGFKIKPSVMKAEYPNNEHASSLQQMSKPFDRANHNANSTSIHPHSEVKPVQKSYHIVNKNNAQQIANERPTLQYGSDFKSTLIQHSKNQKFTNFVSEYNKSYHNAPNQPARTRTVSQFNQTRKEAGNYKQTPEEYVKPITTMFCQNKKQMGDQKQRTDIQRSWVPPKDKSLSFSMGRTAQDLRKGSIPKNDVQTSLNMNIGVHTLHPKLIPDNYFKHARSITVAYNKTLCSKP